jgi:hypothetical protein
MQIANNLIFGNVIAKKVAAQKLKSTHFYPSAEYRNWQKILVVINIHQAAIMT